MKKLILFFTILFLTPAFAADKLHVRALEDFLSIEPKETFSVELIDDGQIDGLFMLRGDKLKLSLFKIKDPTRAKINARIFFTIESYEDRLGEHELKRNAVAKYAKTVINKEEIKKAPKGKYVKKAAGTVGNFFVKGFSYGVSFVDGVAQNQEGNRLKSGVKQVYDDSFLSLVEEGEEVEIKEGDEFYFIVKTYDE